jgi:hypothetical protein
MVWRLARADRPMPDVGRQDEAARRDVILVLAGCHLLRRVRRNRWNQMISTTTWCGSKV